MENTPWNSRENIPSNSMELHGIPWRYFTRGTRVQDVKKIVKTKYFCASGNGINGMQHYEVAKINVWGL